MSVTSWSEIERPVGPQPLPAWLRDVHVDWMEGYGNAPSVRVKTIGERWDNPVFRKDKDAYIAEHPDGRLIIHFHGGAIGRHKIRAFKRLDGTIHQDRRHGPEWPDGDWGGGLRFTMPDGTRIGPEPGEYVDIEMRATTQQEGYAGRHFWLMMDDGEQLVLRGPWRVGVPEGWIAITTVNCDEPMPAWQVKRGHKWWQRQGCFGLELREDVFIAAMSRFAPHIPLARVTYSWGGPYLEAFKAEWGVPKSLHLNRARAA